MFLKRQKEVSRVLPIINRIQLMTSKNIMEIALPWFRPLSSLTELHWVGMLMMQLSRYVALASTILLLRPLVQSDISKWNQPFFGGPPWGGSTHIPKILKNISIRLIRPAYWSTTYVSEMQALNHLKRFLKVYYDPLMRQMSGNWSYWGDNWVWSRVLFRLYFGLNVSG